MKEKITYKATDLFLTLGVKSVTMDDIASEMGISKKTIYANFKNKTALVKECTFWFMDTIHKSIDAISAQDQNPIEELFEIKRFITQRTNNDQYSPQYQLQKYYPEISRAMQKAQFDKITESTIANIKKGKDQGLYRQSIDEEFISRLYFIGITGMRDQDIFPPQQFPTKHITDEFLEYHLRGIVTPEGLNVLNEFIKENQSYVQ